MSSEHTPIDEKDDSPGYRAAVQSAVADQVGGTLTELSDKNKLVGSWKRSFALAPDEEPLLYEYREDGTLVTPYDEVSGPPNKWRLEGNQYIELIWCEPMPEFDLPDGTYDEARYHCAETNNGNIVLWNGDGSIVMILTPSAE